MRRACFILIFMTLLLTGGIQTELNSCVSNSFKIYAPPYNVFSPAYRVFENTLLAKLLLTLFVVGCSMYTSSFFNE